MTKRILVFSLILILVQILISSTSGDTGAENESKFVIAAYWPDYRGYIDINKSASLLTDLILFSIQPDEDGLLKKDMCCLGAEILDKARAAKDLNKSLNLLVSVGGAGRSAAFAGISGDEMRRRVFVQELKRFCLEEGLNGVDFDWEGPSTRDEFISYIHLLVEASTVFHRKGLLVTIALHPGQFLPKEIYVHIDKIHLMTYDMIVETDSHHSSFTDSFNAVESLVYSGCDPAKIVLGLPVYSRNKKDPSRVKTYSEVVDSFLEETGDNQSQQNDLVGLNGFRDFTLESQKLVKRKVRQLVERKLAGVFIWEIGQDYRSEAFPSGLLLHHAYEAFDAADKGRSDEL